MGLFSNCLFNKENDIEFDKKYKIIKTLKNGQFSKVKLIKGRKNKKFYILKELNTKNIKLRTINDEIKCLTKLKSEKLYIVNL